MRCPECGSSQVSVSDSRAADSVRHMPSGNKRRLTPACVEKRWGSNYIYRRRKCMKCAGSWNTVEVVVTGNGYRARSVKW